MMKISTTCLNNSYKIYMHQYTCIHSSIHAIEFMNQKYEKNNILLSLFKIKTQALYSHYHHHIPSHQIVCGGRHRYLRSISSLYYPLTLTLLWCHLEKRLQSWQVYYDLRRDTHVKTNHNQNISIHAFIS